MCLADGRFPFTLLLHNVCPSSWFGFKDNSLLPHQACLFSDFISDLTVEGQRILFSFSLIHQLRAECQVSCPHSVTPATHGDDEQTPAIVTVCSLTMALMQPYKNIIIISVYQTQIRTCVKDS